MVNPRRIRDFARATGRLAKTDALDAEAIALFAERIRPEPRPVAGPDAQALAELVARRRQLVEMIGMEKTRACEARGKRVQQSLAAILKVPEAQLAALDRDIDDAVRGPPVWRAAEDLLTTVPGVPGIGASFRLPNWIPGMNPLQDLPDRAAWKAPPQVVVIVAVLGGAGVALLG